jgi:predicted AlkP superfamily pyrophosphatase or phosphodiesterase
MKRTCVATVLMAAFVLAASAATIPAKRRMVVVISLDGFPAYTLQDPKLPVPTLRRLAERGSSAKRMVPINPTVTWPNHTAMVTGVRSPRHGLLYNGTLVRTGGWPPVKIEPWIDKEQMVHATTVYDVASRQGLTTAEVDWVAIHNARTINWHFPEQASPDGALEREMIEHGALKRSDVENFDKDNIVWRDEIWAKAATYLIREHKPNLLLVHFLTLDSTQHRYGPKTLASEAAMAFLDARVKEILDAIETSGLEDRTTVFIVSDHGFKAFHKQIRPSIALASLGHDAYVVPEGGSAMIYVDKKHRAELVAKIRQTLQGVEGIERIATREDFPLLGLPDPQKDPQMADIVLFAKNDYTFSRPTTNTGPVVVPAAQQGGSHGYLASDPDMDAIFIAAGYGIRPGVRLEQIPNLDVAPTLAGLLGVNLPNVEGRSLRQILQ